MPALPQGTVKAATAGGNTSYDKAQEINLGEEVPFELKKEGDSYQTLYYKYTAPETGTYIVHIKKDDENAELYLNMNDPDGYGFDEYGFYDEDVFQVQEGKTYTFEVYGYYNNANKPDSMKGSVAFVKSDFQFAQQIDSQFYNGHYHAKVYYNESRKLSVTVQNEGNYTYEWKKSGDDTVLSTDSSIDYTVVDSNAVICTIKGEDGTEHEARFYFQCKRIKINSVTVNGEKQVPKEDNSNVSFSNVDFSKVEVVIDAVDLSDPDKAMTYSWRGSTYSSIKSLNDELNSTTNTYVDDQEKGYNRIECHIYNGNDSKCVYIDLSYSNTIKYNTEVNINGNKQSGNSYAYAEIGNKVSFKVNAKTSSSGTLKYQWYANNNGTYEKIDSATGEEYTIDSVNDYGRKYYYCVVSDGKSKPAEVSFTLDVSSITYERNIKVNGEENQDDNSDVTVNIGDKVELVVSASEKGNSTEPIQYHWYGINGEKTDGATGNTYIVDTSKGGNLQYRCEIDDGLTTQDIYFYVNVKTFNIENKNAMVNGEKVDDSYSIDAKLGDKVELSFDAKGVDSSSDVKYEWYRITNGDWNTRESLDSEKNTCSFTVDHGGRYQYNCRVTYGSYSEEVNFSVTIKTFDIENQTIKINGESTDYDSYATAKLGDKIELSFDAKGVDSSSDVKYEWYRYTDGDWNNQETLDSTDKNTYTFTADHAGRYQYQCRVTYGGYSEEASFSVTIKTFDIENQIIKINGEPTDGDSYVTAKLGDKIELSFDAKGADSLSNASYKWSRIKDGDYNNRELLDATGNTYSFTADKGGNYRYCCTVTYNGYSEDVDFLVEVQTLTIENSKITINGVEQEDTDVYAHIGDEVKMSLDAKTSNPTSEGITYHWTQRYNDDYSHTTNLDKVTGNTYTFVPDKGGEYYFAVSVSDGADTQEEEFFVSVVTISDINSQVKVTSKDGKDKGSYNNYDFDEDKSLQVDIDDKVELNVSANSMVNKNLTYTWMRYKYSDTEYGNDIGSGKTLVLTKDTTKNDHIYCRISDGDYSKFVYFNIHRSSIRYTAETFVNDEPVTDYDDFNVVTDDTVKLKVNATSTQNSNLTYKWTRSQGEDEKEEDVTTKIPSTCIIPSKTLPKDSSWYYTCTVSDGTSTENIYFYIDVDLVNATKTVTANGKPVAGDNNYFTVNKSDKVVLAFSINDGNSYHYTWKAYDDDEHLPSKTLTSGDTSTGSSFEIPAGLMGEYEDFNCILTDDNKNTQYVSYYLNYTQQEIAVESVALDKTDLTLETGSDSVKLTATVAPENATNKSVIWTSSDSSVASVDQDGNVKALKAGTATITATTEDGSKTASCKVTVKDSVIAATGVKLSETSLNLNKDESRTLTATVEPANATNKKVTWTSSNEKIARVDQNGTIKALAAGTAEITVTTEDGSHTAKCTVNVTEHQTTVTVTDVKLDKSSLELKKGEKGALTATVLPEDATNKSVTWTSSDEKVATVDQNGNVKAVSEGTADITVTTADGSKKATCKVVVKDPTVSVENVKLNESSLTLRKDDSKILTATVLPQNATNKNVTWESTDKTVVSVEKNGMIKGLKAGKATIIVKTVDGEKTAECVVEVTIPVTGVTISADTLTLNKNETKALKATVLPEDATNKGVTWKSSNTSVATVDPNGNVKALKAGKTTITVTTKDGNKSASCEVTVNEPAPQPQPEPQPQPTPQLVPTPQPATDPAPVGTSVTVGGSVYKVTAPGSVTYVKNTKKKAKKVTVKDTVNVNGKVLPVTGIANNAFKNNKKLTTVVIGKNVTTIGKNIFKGDKSLKKVIVKTVKLNSKSIKNLAKSVKFRGAKVTVKVPKAKKKVFKKIFKKSAKKAKVK